MKICQKCSSEMPENFKVCGSCGNPFEAQKKICQGCGAEVSVSMNFCEDCGAAYGTPIIKAAPTKPKKKVPVVAAVVLCGVIGLGAVFGLLKNSGDGAGNVGGNRIASRGNNGDKAEVFDEIWDVSLMYTTGNEIVTDEVFTVDKSPDYYQNSAFSYSGLYTGEWKDGKPDGYGSFTSTIRHVSGGKKDEMFLFDYEGFWVNGEITGFGRVFSYNHWGNAVDTIIEGEFINGVIHGFGREITSPDTDDIRILEVEFNFGKPEGKGMIVRRDSISEGTFIDGRLREGKITFSDGSVYEGQITSADGLRTESSRYQGKLTAGDGSFYIEGLWGRPPNIDEVKKMYTYNNEVRATAFTRIMHGPVKIVWSNGVVYDGNARAESGGNSFHGNLRMSDGTNAKVYISPDGGEFLADRSDYYEALGIIIGVGILAIYADAAFSYEPNPATDEYIRSVIGNLGPGKCDSCGKINPCYNFDDGCCRRSACKTVSRIFDGFCSEYCKSLG